MIRNAKSLESIESSLQKVVRKSLQCAPASQGPALTWPLACGSTVADRTRAVEFVKGVLTVEVPDAGWRTELQRLAPQYLAVINRYAVNRVNQIQFVLKARTEEQRRPEPRNSASTKASTF